MPRPAARKSMENCRVSFSPSQVYDLKYCRSSPSSAWRLSQLDSRDEVKYTRFPSQLWDSMLICAPIFSA